MLGFHRSPGKNFGIFVGLFPFLPGTHLACFVSISRIRLLNHTIDYIVLDYTRFGYKHHSCNLADNNLFPNYLSHIGCNFNRSSHRNFNHSWCFGFNRSSDSNRIVDFDCNIDHFVGNENRIAIHPGNYNSASHNFNCNSNHSFAINHTKGLQVELTAHHPHRNWLVMPTPPS